MRKKHLILAVVSFVWLFIPVYTQAETLNLLSLPPTTYGGYYVGPIGGNIDGGYSMSFYCNDFATTTYVPSSFAVAVSTMSDLSQTKFGATPDAIFKYQQTAWLVSQMETNPAQVGPIQFAAWSIFTPSTPLTIEAKQWVTAAKSINPADFNFNSVRIYTPTNTINQEFFGGFKITSALPEPPVVFLLGFGLLVLVFFKKGRATKTSKGALKA